MKGTPPPPATVEAFNEDTRSHHDSPTESDDEDKLVIDLDPNVSTMSNSSDSSSTKKLDLLTKPAKTAELSSPEESSSHNKDQIPAPNTKNGEANPAAPQVKTKGKRGGNKNKSTTDNKNAADNSASNPTNGNGNKGAKPDKNPKTNNADKDSGKTTPAGKPGRKKKEKLPTIKTENGSLAAVSDSDPGDPYKFDQSDEKTISSTTAGKHSKTKVGRVKYVEFIFSQLMQFC